MKKIITVLFSVLLTAGLFTSCNGDATSSLVNDSVTTTITMSVDGNFMKGLIDSAPDDKKPDFCWFIMGMKPGSNEEDKLLEVVESFSADNPSFSKEIEVVAETPVMFGILAGDEWLAVNENQVIPVQWKITGHKINESGTENCTVSKYEETYRVRTMALDPNDLRMTDTVVNEELKNSEPFYLLNPVAKTIGHSSVKAYTEKETRSASEEIIVNVPQKRSELNGGKGLYGGEQLVEALTGSSSAADSDTVDRFGKLTWDKIFVVESSSEADISAAVEKVLEGKLLVVPGKVIYEFAEAISFNGDSDIGIWVPYLTEDISDAVAENIYLYFAVDKDYNTYFSYSDFSKWVSGCWCDNLSDGEIKSAIETDFQDEIDAFSMFLYPTEANSRTSSRDAADPVKELEKEISGTTYRFKIYHANYTSPADSLFLASTSKTEKELLAKYEWTYIKNGKDSGDTASLVKGHEESYDYGKLNKSTRIIRLWTIHNVKDHTHMYLIKDQADMNFSQTYIANGNGRDTSIEQRICNNSGNWKFYGSGSSLLTVAKGKEWYGDSAWIQTKVVKKGGSSMESGYVFSNTSPATTTVTKKISNGFSFNLDMGFSVERDDKKIKPKGELKGGFHFSDSVTYDVPEVSIFYKSTGDYVRWDYTIRDDWDCSFHPFRYAGSNVKSQPSNTSVSNLKPNESIYMITVDDKVVNDVQLELICGSKLKRKAFKAGVTCCVGYSSAEAKAYSSLPYDLDKSHYEGGKFPWE